MYVWSLLMFAIFTQNNVSSSFAIVVTIIDYNCNIKVAVGVDGAWYMIFNLLEVHIEMVESLLKTQYALTMSFNAMPIISPIWIYCVVQGHNELGRCLPSLEI
jgi:hypothetical protein